MTLHNGSCKWTASGQADMQGAAACVCVCLSGLWDVLAIPQSKVVNTLAQRESEADSHIEMRWVPHLPGRWHSRLGWEIDSLANGVG